MAFVLCVKSAVFSAFLLHMRIVTKVIDMYAGQSSINLVIYSSTSIDDRYCLLD